MPYDLIAIGGGAAGLNVAVPAAKLGLKTLLIDKAPEKIGGECLHTGCVPSKALLHVAKLMHDARKLGEFGLTIDGSLDFSKVHDYVRRVQDQIHQHETPEALQEFGMDFAFGEAKFISPDTLQVGEKTYQGRRIVLATGSRPRIPSVPGLENIEVLTNENLFQLRERPSRLLVAGAGPIGIEMSQAFRRLGSDVAVVERSGRILPRDSEEAAGLMQRHLEQEGIRFHLGSEIVEFPSPNTARIKTSSGEIDQGFDRVLIAVGKSLDYSSLDLSAAGITLTNGKLQLDSYLRTTNKRVCAAGDAAGQIFLTHATELHGAVILWNLFSPIKKKIRYDNLGWVTFTDPEVATFGLSERELQRRGVNYRKVVQGFEDVNRAVTDNYPESKLIVYLKGDRLLGGTMVAPGAGELIQELILAKQYKIPLRKLLEKTYPYPTAGRINRWLAIWEFDRKTTPAMKKVLQTMFRWMN